MRFEEILQKIHMLHPELTFDKILRMIDEKEKEAKGFLTRESAARVIGAELGIESSGKLIKRDIYIKNLIAGLNNVTIVGRVISVYPVQKFTREDGKEGKTRRLIVADKTGDTKVILWNGKADFPEAENLTGKIVRFLQGYVRRGLNGRPELNIGSKGRLEIYPEDTNEKDLPSLV